MDKQRSCTYVWLRSVLHRTWRGQGVCCWTIDNRAADHYVAQPSSSASVLHGHVVRRGSHVSLRKGGRGRERAQALRGRTIERFSYLEISNAASSRAVSCAAWILVLHLQLCQEQRPMVESYSMLFGCTTLLFPTRKNMTSRIRRAGIGHRCPLFNSCLHTEATCHLPAEGLAQEPKPHQPNARERDRCPASWTCSVMRTDRPHGPDLDPSRRPRRRRPRDGDGPLPARSQCQRPHCPPARALEGRVKSIFGTL